MRTLPLLCSASPETIVARRGSEAISAERFLRQAQRIAALLPPDGELLNLCADRHHFGIALAAGLLAGRCTLLPPTQAPEVLRQLQALGRPLVALGDASAAPAALLEHGCHWLNVGAHISALPEQEASEPGERAAWPVPQVDAERTAVVIFTSGSTGAPVPHAKSFGQLVAAARVQISRLPANDAGAGYALLGTVPPQHMFGLEATVILPLQSGGVLCAERPFFPADIAAALSRLPRPRALVSTPVHLRAVLDSCVSMPAVDLVLCATAPLSQSLAREVEARCHAPLLEIFGSTETGQIASRRTAHERLWCLYPDVRLWQMQQRWWAQGGHVEAATLLADMLEPTDETHFILHGRSADLVNVAGKRSSLSHLSQQLLAIPGVLDGAFFPAEQLRSGPRAASLTGVSRLAAVAVAPQLTRAQILTALRERIDAVFLPRPLWLVERLPRNDTGKLPYEALRGLAAQLSGRRSGSTV